MNAHGTFSTIYSHLHLVHGQIREQDDEIVLDSDDESRISFVLAVDNFDVISGATLEKLLSYEIQVLFCEHVAFIFCRTALPN